MPSMHQANIVRGILLQLHAGTSLDPDNDYAAAVQMVNELEEQLASKAKQLKEFKEPLPKSRNGREVTQLRHLAHNLMVMFDWPEEIQGLVWERLSRPVENPTEVVAQLLVEYLERVA